MITKVRDKVENFLRGILELKRSDEIVRVTGISKVDDGWTSRAEVIERNRLLPEYRVFEKKYYIVKLNSDMEIYSYKEVEKKEGQEEGPEPIY